MEKKSGPNLKVINGIAGVIIGIPLSYYFQPGIIRAKVDLGEYIQAFPSLVMKMGRTPSEILIPAILTPAILAIVGVLIGHFMMKNRDISSDGKPVSSEGTANARLFSETVDAETRAAIEGYQLKLKKDDANIDLMHEYGKFLEKHHLIEEAILVLIKAVTLDPEDTRVKGYMYDLYRKTGNTEKAIGIGKELFEDNVANESFPLSFLKMLSENNQQDLALALAGDFLKTNPNHIDVLLLRAELLSASQSGDAIDCFKTISAIDPDNVDALYNIARYDYSQANHKAAALTLKKLLPMVKDDRKALCKTKAYLALALHQLDGHADKVEEILKTCDPQDILGLNLDSDDDTMAFLVLAGDHLKEKQNYADAAALFGRAMDIAPDQGVKDRMAQCRYHRAVTFYENDNYPDAESELDKALQLNKENKQCLELKKKIVDVRRSKRLRVKVAAAAVVVLACCAFGAWYASHGNIVVRTAVPANDIALMKKGRIVRKALNAKALSVRFLPSGNYTLVVQTDGHEQHSADIHLGWLEKKNVSVEQVPMFGGIALNSHPPEMAVYINGRHAGKTPFKTSELLAKPSRIVLRKDGYYWEKNVDIQKDKIIDLGKPMCVFSLDNLEPDQIVNPVLAESDYCADFDTQKGGWQDLKDKAYDISVQNGKLIFSTYTESRYSWRGKLIKGDFWYSADLQKTSPGYHNAYYGIAFRADYIPTYRNNYKNIWTFFGISDNGRYKIVEYKSGSGGHTLKDGKLHQNVQGRLNNLAVQCLKDVYTCYVNGQKITTVQNSKHAGAFKGNVGVGIDTGRVTVAYDNLYVKEVPYNCRLHNERVIEDFNGSQSDLDKKYASKFLTIKDGKAQYAYWKGWVWNQYFDAPADNYSVKMTCSAKGKKAKWGPILLASSETKHDGNRNYTNYYCVGMNVNKDKKFVIFYYDSTAGSYYRLKELYSGACPEIKPNDTNEFRVDKQHNYVTFFINDSYVAELNLQSKQIKKKLNSGKIGFFIDNGSALFDDIRISDIR